jgi:hypothetical protein
MHAKERRQRHRVASTCKRQPDVSGHHKRLLLPTKSSDGLIASACDVVVGGMLQLSYGELDSTEAAQTDDAVRRGDAARPGLRRAEVEDDSPAAVLHGCAECHVGAEAAGTDVCAYAGEPLLKIDGEARFDREAPRQCSTTL